jgi:hypothetical protein
VRWLLILLVGCGRVGFDAQSPTGDGGDATMVNGTTVPAGPAVWLRMDTDPTTGIIDSGGGHTVECALGCPTLAAGKHASGYQFSGNQVDIAPAADLQGSAFTAAIWIKIDAIPSAMVCPWNKTFDPMNGYDTFALCIDTSGMVVYHCESSGGVSSISESSNVSVADGTWHHIAMTWDGTDKGDWLDGMEIAGATFPIGSANMGLSLGASRSGFFVTGTLDEALYYTRALTPAEIAMLAAP